MKLGMTIIGDLARDLEAAAKSLEKGVTVGTRHASDGLKLALRNQVTGAGLGPKVAKAWQNRHYPSGAPTSLDAASVVWTKAPKIIAAYDRGVLLKAKGGIYLAIPTANAPKMYSRRRVSPSNWPERTFGKLRFVKTRRGTAFLVAPNLMKRYKKTGEFKGYGKATKKHVKGGGETEDIIMFILIQQRRIPKKLDVEREFKKWTARLPDIITKEASRQ